MQYIEQTIHANISVKTWLIILDQVHLCFLWLGSSQFEAKSINQKPVGIFSQNFSHIFTSLLVHIWLKIKITIKRIFIVSPVLNINWDALIIFLSFWGVLMHYTGRRLKCKKRLQVIILPGKRKKRLTL